MSNTNLQYDKAIDSCRDIYYKKFKDYGTSWRLLRIISITDQLYIKAQRIRTLQEKGVQQIEDGIYSEFKAMVNYGIIGLIQIELAAAAELELSEEQALNLYDRYADTARQTMLKKNHDYGEAWRAMSQESFVDLILVKLMRIRQILANEGRTLVSEGIDSNFIDIINYSLFALILIDEGIHKGD